MSNIPDNKDQLKEVVTIGDLYRILTGVEPWPVDRRPVPNEVSVPAANWLIFPFVGGQ